VKYRDLVAEDGDCAIAQALGVLGDWWTLLILRDVAGGHTRFTELAEGLGTSRKVLTQRLHNLVRNGVLQQVRYSDHPARFEYHLTEKGQGLLPVLVALQDWGSRFVLGDGTMTGTSSQTSAEAHRVASLVGHRIPEITLTTAGGEARDPLDARGWTVLYCFPGARGPNGGKHPPGWDTIPGAVGCTLESRTFRDQLGEFHRRRAGVHGVSTQRPDELADFAQAERLGFPLLSDQHLQLTSALRLPTFRADGVDRIKRLTLLVDADRTVRKVLYPIADPAGSVADALRQLAALSKTRA
jgi:DNA-binding HxlR family transcriptional regulator/peroxiredoxin